MRSNLKRAKEFMIATPRKVIEYEIAVKAVADRHRIASRSAATRRWIADKSPRYNLNSDFLKAGKRLENRKRCNCSWKSYCRIFDENWICEFQAI